MSSETAIGLPSDVMATTMEAERAEVLGDDDEHAASVREVRGPPACRAGNGARSSDRRSESGWLRQSTKNPRAFTEAFSHMQEKTVLLYIHFGVKRTSFVRTLRFWEISSVCSRKERGVVRRASWFRIGCELHQRRLPQSRPSRLAS